MFIPRSSLSALILLASLGSAAARPALCLVEADGKALISGPCEFETLDPGGSFKVSLKGGASAEVRIAGEEATVAFQPPLRGSSGAVSGVDHNGGCWATPADAARRVKVCAFAGAGFNVEPDPQFDKSADIYWGLRVGMFDEIESRQDLDSSHARLRTIPSRSAALIYCREYTGDYTQACIDKALAARHPQELTADCPKKHFTGFDGWRVAFVGPNRGDPSVAPLTKYLFRDVASGRLLDGSGASSYALAEGVYAELCPKTAPTPEE